MPSQLQDTSRYAVKTDVTIGIGAICRYEGKPRIVLCSDMRVEDEYIGSDTCVKFESAGGHWVCLMAGVFSGAKRLTGYYREVLNDPALSLTQYNLFDIVAEAPKRMLLKMTEELIYKRLRMERSEFYAALPTHERFLAVQDEISALKLDCSLLLAGFVQDEPYLFLIDEDGQISWREHYALLGRGQFEAHAILQQRSYVQTIEVLDALYLVYEAKLWSEKVNSVGNQNTSLLVIEPPTPEYGLGIRWVDALVGLPF